MDFAAIALAGVTQDQFAELVGVSRVTVNTWVKGRFRPRAGIKHAVAAALAQIRAALDAGELPVRVPARGEATRIVLASVRDRLNHGTQ